jgi:ferredoxin
MHIEVDIARCCGSGMCALVAPALFDQRRRDGTVVVLRPEVTGLDQILALECERNCPCGAIALCSDPAVRNGEDGRR